MKKPPTLLVVPDGVADWEQPELNGKTPLEYADTPNLDKLCEHGRIVRLQNIPSDCPADSGIANMSLLGYDPREHYLGRGPMEALNLGIELEAGQTAFRCNLVSVNENGTLEDYSAGNFPTEKSTQLFQDLDNHFEDQGFHFYPGIRYRGVLVVDDLDDVECYLPHDEMGRSLTEIWPEGKGGSRIKSLMQESREVLENHPINTERGKNGKFQANMAWPWGNGQMSDTPSVTDRYGINGSVVAGVDLINGLGISIGLEKVNVPGATGDFDTDMHSKAKAALEHLEDNHMVYLHLEATDEAGHEGDANLKVEMIEKFDTEMVSQILDAYSDQNFRIALGPDHYTPIQERTHVDDPVPFLIVNGTDTDNRKFTEAEAANGELIETGWERMAEWYSGKSLENTAQTQTVTG